MVDDPKVHRGGLRLFHWIEDWPLTTRGIEWYRSIIRDDAAYAEHEAVMEKFFSNPIEMFPFKEGLDRPPRYFEIQGEEIANRFPGNRGYVGDADIRDMVKAFADIFRRNIVWFVAVKKLILALSVALLLALFFNPAYLNASACRTPVLGDDLCQRGWLSYALPTAGGLVVLALVLIAFRALNGYLAQRYREALRASAYVISKSALSRTKSLYSLFGDLMHQIDEEKMSLKDQDRRNWPREAGRWMVMSYWVSQRLEYIERYVQIQMWRIRRAHYWINRGGYLLTWAIAVLSLAAIVLIGLIGHEAIAKTHPAKLPVLALVVLVIAYMNRVSYATPGWRTPLSLVRDTLDTKQWSSYGSLRVHERLGRQIHNDKQALVEADEFKRGH